MVLTTIPYNFIVSVAPIFQFLKSELYPHESKFSRQQTGSKVNLYAEEKCTVQ